MMVPWNRLPHRVRQCRRGHQSAPRRGSAGGAAGPVAPVSPRRRRRRGCGSRAFQLQTSSGSVRLRIFGIAFGGVRHQHAARRIILRLHVVRHAIVGQHLFGNPLEHRRRDLPALMQPARRIQNHRNGHRGIVDRGKAHKAGHVVGLRIGVGHRIDLLRRARLSRRGVAVQNGAPRRTLHHHLFGQPAHEGIRVGGDDAVLPLGMKLDALVTLVRRRDPGNDARRRVNAVVGNRRHHRHHLQRRHSDRLSDRHRSNGRGMPVAGIAHNSARLARQFDVGSLPEAVGPDVLVEALRPQPQRHLHRGHIAGHGIGLLQIDRADMAVIVNADSADQDVAGVAVHDLFRPSQLFIEERRVVDGLEDRARLIDVADRMVL